MFDVTDADGIAAAAAAVESLDALVDNAGIAIAAPLEFLPPEELTRQLDVNVVGQLRVLQAFLPALRRSRGRIVLMGSIGGRSALPFLGAYAMSKFALEAMADALRVELAPFGMRGRDRRAGDDRHSDLVEAAARRRRASAGAAELYGSALAKFRALAASRASQAVSAGRGGEGRRARAQLAQAEDALRRRTRCEAPRPGQKLPDRLRDRVLTRYLFGS